MFRSNQNITSRRFVSAPRLRRRSTLATTLRAVRGFAENKKDTIVQKNKPKVIDVFFRLYRQVRKVFAEQTGELLKRRSSLLNTQSTESVSWSTQGTSRNVHSLFLSAARSLRRFSQAKSRANLFFWFWAKKSPFSQAWQCCFCPVLLSRRLKYESILALLDFKTEQNQGCQVEEFHGDKVFLREAVTLKQYFVYCKKWTQCGGKD